MIDRTVGHYRIVEQLGEGGMGIVYKAEDTKLKRTVALKFLPEHLQASHDDKQRFVLEAQAASALNHPNVCTIHDIQEHDGRMFIVMELVQGQTLRALMQSAASGGGGEQASGARPAQLSLHRAVEIGIQIADGLGAAHEKGITHRDVKPENIMVRKDGIVQIMDFGLAKLRSTQGSRLTKQGSTVGTAGYMSPEQIQGGETDHRSDIFSLGVLLYEMFTGEKPFKGVHESALLYEVVNVDPPPLTAVNSSLSPDLDRIVFECLQKEPDERFQSVKDISKELKRYKRESSRAHATRVMTARKYPSGETATGASDIESGPGAGRGSGIQSSGVHGTGVPGSGVHGSGVHGSGVHGAVSSIGAGAASTRGGWRRYIWPAIAALLATALVVMAMRRPADQGSQAGDLVLRFPVNLALTTPLVLGAATLAIAPDGKNFVYLAGDPVNPLLYLRPLDKLTGTPMTSTEGASDPFFSADGKWVAFFSAGKLVKVSTFGGASQPICEVPGFMRGGFWAEDGTIFFGHLNRGIHRVPASGGTPVEVTIPDSAGGEISHRFPQVLAGGKWVVFTVKFDNIVSFDDAAIVAENIETHERRELVRGGSYGRVLESGHLMYARGQSLFAIQFDPERVEVSGSPIPVLEGGMLSQYSGTANFEASKNGIMIYSPYGDVRTSDIELAWIDRKGGVTRAIPEIRPYDNARLSPDGKRIAVCVRAANDDIWIYDLVRQGFSRLTFGGGNSDLPAWTQDGKEVIIAAERGRRLAYFRRPWDGSGTMTDMGIDNNLSNNFGPTLSPDGSRMVYAADGDVWSVNTAGGSQPTRIIRSEATEDAPRLSPDGSILAFTSDESGVTEIYAVPASGQGGKWQISTGGGANFPIWSPKGDELFFISKGSLMKVNVTRSPAVAFSSPRTVCELPKNIYRSFDISPDGNKILIGITHSPSASATEVYVVVGWFNELKQKFLTATSK